MNIVYFFGGICALLFGLYIVIKQIKTFIKGEQDQVGWDIKLLGGGLIFIMIGITLIMDSLPL